MRGQDAEMWPRPPCYLLSSLETVVGGCLSPSPGEVHPCPGPILVRDKVMACHLLHFCFPQAAPPHTHISLVGGIRIIHGDGRLPVPPQIPPTPFLEVGKEDASVAS